MDIRTRLREVPSAVNLVKGKYVLVKGKACTITEPARLFFEYHGTPNVFKCGGCK